MNRFKFLLLFLTSVVSPFLSVDTKLIEYEGLKWQPEPLLSRL